MPENAGSLAGILDARPADAFHRLMAAPPWYLSRTLATPG
jgi:hypothetical protein